jgi:hypothetical protein
MRNKTASQGWPSLTDVEATFIVTGRPVWHEPEISVTNMPNHGAIKRQRRRDDQAQGDGGADFVVPARTRIVPYKPGQTEPPPEPPAGIALQAVDSTVSRVRVANVAGPAFRARRSKNLTYIDCSTDGPVLLHATESERIKVVRGRAGQPPSGP